MEDLSTKELNLLMERYTTKEIGIILSRWVARIQSRLGWESNVGNTFTWLARNIRERRLPLLIGVLCGLAGVLPDLDHFIFYATGWEWPAPFYGRPLHPFILILAIYMVIHYCSRIRRYTNK